MKTTTHTDQKNRLPNVEANQKYLQEFRGHPELVKFPSTSELFRTLLENTLYASSITNSQGRILEVNETFSRIFGYTSGKMTELTTKELFDTTERKYAEYADQMNFNGKAKAKITGVRRDGDRFSCEITSLVFIDDEGERRTINTIVDISKFYSHILFE
jgi:PAS domain S-box-containing protein